MTLNTLTPTSTRSGAPKPARSVVCAVFWHTCYELTMLRVDDGADLSRSGNFVRSSSRRHLIAHTVSVAHDTIAPNERYNEGNYATKEISTISAFLLSFPLSFLSDIFPAGIPEEVSALFLPMLADGATRRTPTPPPPRDDDKTMLYPKRDWIRSVMTTTTTTR